MMRNPIEKALEYLSNLNKHLLLACRYAMIITLAGILIVVCVGVFFRYVLNNSLVWTEEVAKFTMVWLCFVGSPVVMRHGGHVAIELFTSRVKGLLKLAFIIFGQLIIILVLLLLIWKGIDLAVKALPQRSTAVTWLSLFWVYLAVPTGSLLMLPVTST